MRVAFVASLGLLGSVLLAQTGQPRSLITTNGGFEDGTEGWRADAAYELVIDPQMAYEGQKCLSGEVRAPNTHLTLAREFNLKAGALYTLSVWARGTNQTKIAVWRTSSTGHRENVAQWENQRPQWKRYEVSFAVETTGNWTLELIAPSSHGAPPGRVWLDNIQLSELDVPTPIDIAQGEGFNDWPRMVRSGDELFVTWISFRDGADQLMVAKTSLEGTLEWSVPVDFGERKGPYVLEPRLVPTGGGAWLLWAAELSGDWEIFAMKVISSGPQGCIRVTKHRGPDVKPVGVVYNGELFVAYETSLQGRRQVAIVRVTKGKPGRPQIISGPTGQHYEPCLAAPEKGPLTAAWSTFDNHNGDISIATFEGGRWSKPRRLTTAPTLDRHAVLYSAGADLWIAWENANSVAYHIGANNSRRIAIAKLRSDGLMSPVSLKTSPLWQWAEQATLAVDERGRLWVAYLVPRNRNVGWDVHLNCFSGTDCSASYRVSSMKGMDRPISLAFNRERLLAVFQADDLPNRWQTVEEALHSKAYSGVYFVSLDIAQAPQPRPIQTALYVEPDDPYEAGELRLARGEDRPIPTIHYRGQELKLYFGDLHEHTDVSVCNRTGDSSIDESYQSMRDIARYDFACVTDHDYNQNAYLWNYTAKLARANEDPGKFLTFLAEEWTSSIEEYSEQYPEGYYGHRNLIFEDPYWPYWYNAFNKERPTELWKRLDEQGASYVHIPHQLADTGNVPVDWNEVDEVRQPVAEIFQTRGSYEYDSAPRQAAKTIKGHFIQEAWAKGVVIGIVAAPDHGGGYGKAAVFAPKLTRKAILEAIRQRHTYGTTGAKIVLDVRVEGRLMGEKIKRESDGPVTVQVSVNCPQDIKRIDICRNNEFVYTRQGTGRRDRFTYQDTAPLEGLSYYYVRVIQVDDEIAWSSPVWLTPT